MKEKLFRVSLAVMLLLTLMIQPTSAAGKIKVKVTFVGAELVENNHVGNEWWWGGYVNGQEVADGDSVTLDVSSSGSIKLKAEAQEQDKIPESGTASATVNVGKMKSAQTKALSVTVVENRGRYSGNTATWKFTFQLEKVK